MQDLALVLTVVFTGMVVLTGMLGIFAHYTLKPYIAALAARQQARVDADRIRILEQRFALLEERQQFTEQSISPLLEDGVLRR